MRISADIPYWGPGVATFDPQKVLARLQAAFPAVTIDDRDLAQEEVERFIHFLNTEQTPEPRRSSILREIRGKATRNGPAYNFVVKTDHDGILRGQVARYHVSFTADQVLTLETELAIIRFLRSLQLGTLMCDTATTQFHVPHDSYLDHWILADDASDQAIDLLTPPTKER